MAKSNLSKRLSDFNFTKDEVFELAEFVCENLEKDFSADIKTVLGRLCEIPESSCAIRVTDGDGLDDYVTKWVNKFFNGKSNSSSQRKSNPIGTIHDGILDTIISAKLAHLNNEEVQKIKFAHRLCMAAENIAGSFLEEFLTVKLEEYGWYCCWGETARSIDFINVSGDLLQVKNSDNSENSSSKTVRDGTNIKHWFRRKSSNGTTNWEALNQMLEIQDAEDKLTENLYNEFVKQTISNNPDCISIEVGNSWSEIKIEVRE